MFEKHKKYVVRELHQIEGHKEINQWIFMFTNDYGVSVICHKINGQIISYGNTSNPYELAVLDNEYEPCYDTPITDDVIGYLTEEDIEKYLDEIMKLEDKAK